MTLSGSEPPDELFERVHHDLRGLARGFLSGERREHTLQPTALVHEVYLKLRDELALVRESPERFYAAAAEAMRRILIDHARKRNRAKRGGGLERLPLDLVEVARTASLDQVLAVDEAIQALAQEHPRAAEVVRLRFLVGLTEPEVAEVLTISERTIRREWTFARAWLFRHLSGRGE